ncbi:hypothetical protein EGM51_10720 [Verrucomicrobia bacterium S94]|nr:hypothetical protein EGM51_10720 [Verrucomicrobia bacterium S94]
MSRCELVEICSMDLDHPVRFCAEKKLYADLDVGDDTYRWNVGYADTVTIKRRTFGKDGKSYGGWSTVAKFSAEERDNAYNTWSDLCFRSENPMLPGTESVDIDTEDMQPIETGSDHYRTPMDIAVQRAIELVDLSKKFAKVSVICAAQAGAEFARIKDHCERGEWMKVLNELPFGKSTVYKYIRVADEMQTRLAEGETAIDLHHLPSPEELISGDHADVIDRINAVTGEQSLRQLYFDWGILKSPEKTAVKKPAQDNNTPAQLAEIRRRDANEAIGSLCVDLQNICINEKRCIERADLDHIRTLEGDLIDALKNVRTIITAG